MRDYFAALMARAIKQPGYVPRGPQIPEVRFLNTSREQGRRLRQDAKRAEKARIRALIAVQEGLPNE